MKLFPMLLTLLIATSTSAIARIGETLEECEKRYGPPILSIRGGEAFKKGEFIIHITFFEGKADCVSYIKMTNDKSGQSEGFSDSEIEQLMKANCGGREFKKIRLASGESQWRSVDDELIATYRAPERALVIFTKASSVRDSAKLKEKEAKGIEGL